MAGVDRTRKTIEEWIDEYLNIRLGGNGGNGGGTQPTDTNRYLVKKNRPINCSIMGDEVAWPMDAYTIYRVTNSKYTPDFPIPDAYIGHLLQGVFITGTNWPQGTNTKQLFSSKIANTIIPIPDGQNAGLTWNIDRFYAIPAIAGNKTLYRFDAAGAQNNTQKPLKFGRDSFNSQQLYHSVYDYNATSNGYFILDTMRMNALGFIENLDASLTGIFNGNWTIYGTSYQGLQTDDFMKEAFNLDNIVVQQI